MFHLSVSSHLKTSYLAQTSYHQGELIRHNLLKIEQCNLFVHGLTYQRSMFEP